VTAPIAPLLDALRACTSWLRATKAKGAVIGGVAASIHGQPRVTRDVDIVALVADDGWAAFLAAGAKFGILPRRADALAFARRTRVLLLRHAPSTVDLDVSLGAIPFEHELVRRAKTKRIGGVSFRLAAAEDIVVMKALARRPRDIADIEGILSAVPDLALDRVRRDLRSLSESLEGPDFVSELERLLSHHRRSTATGKGAPKRRRRSRI
jgi:hypothetical protein